MQGILFFIVVKSEDRCLIAFSINDEKPVAICWDIDNINIGREIGKSLERLKGSAVIFVEMDSAIVRANGDNLILAGDVCCPDIGCWFVQELKESVGKGIGEDEEESWREQLHLLI